MEHPLISSLRADHTNASAREIVAGEIWGTSAENDRRAELLREGRLPLFELDRRAAKALQGCRMPPGSFPKRLARTLTNPDLETVSPLQMKCLWRCCYSYRKQIQDDEINRMASWLRATWQDGQRVHNLPGRTMNRLNKLARVAPLFSEWADDLVE